MSEGAVDLYVIIQGEDLATAKLASDRIYTAADVFKDAEQLGVGATEPVFVCRLVDFIEPY